MNLRLLSVLCVLFLTACGTRTVKDDLPASDLDALASNVRNETRPTLLPNGKEYCMEDARTEDEQDECSGQLEDAVFNGNRKLERIWNTVNNAIFRLRVQRNPCSRWEKFWRVDRCNAKNSATP